MKRNYRRRTIRCLIEKWNETKCDRLIKNLESLHNLLARPSNAFLVLKSIVFYFNVYMKEKWISFIVRFFSINMSLIMLLFGRTLSHKCCWISISWCVYGLLWFLTTKKSLLNNLVSFSPDDKPNSATLYYLMSLNLCAAVADLSFCNH